MPDYGVKPACRAEWLSFYADVFGWTKNPQLSIDGERIFLRAPTNMQYVNVRASDTLMQTHGYEHLGVAVTSPEEVRTIHARAHAWAVREPRVELGTVKVVYGGCLHTFRVRFVLPLTIEVQCFVDRPASDA